MTLGFLGYKEICITCPREAMKIFYLLILFCLASRFTRYIGCVFRGLNAYHVAPSFCIRLLQVWYCLHCYHQGCRLVQSASPRLPTRVGHFFLEIKFILEKIGSIICCPCYLLHFCLSDYFVGYHGFHKDSRIWVGNFWQSAEVKSGW